VRTFGLVLLCGGALLFFVCSTQMSDLPPVPDGTSLGDYFQYEAGRYELGRYGAAMMGLIGAILALFPKGR
jgi:hypothetical protein